MTTAPTSTVAAANLFVAALMLPLSPSVSSIPVTVEQQNRFVGKTTTLWLAAESDRVHKLADVEQSTSVAAIGHVTQYNEADRPTTPQERLVGELRSWSLLTENWDGEGAAAPDARSLKEAVAFIRLLGEGIVLPEPMLHASGHAGLFWKDDGLYADMKFLGDGHLAYYIERQGDKHKGVLNFDSKKMPAVFSAILQA